MVAMAKEHGLKIYFRTTPKLRGFYNRLTGALRATDALSSKPGYTSNDAIINALLLWAADRDPEDLVKELGPHLALFEGIWDEVLASQTELESPDASVVPQAEPTPPAAPHGDQQWVTGGIRQRTDGDNAKFTQKNRPSRETPKRMPKDAPGISESSSTPTTEPGKGRGGRKGKASSS